MTDNRFKLISILGTIIIISIAAMLILPGKLKSHSSKSEPAKSAKSEYVYIDICNILHADRKCSRLNYKGMTSKRVKKTMLLPSEYKSYCPKCVDDDLFSELSAPKKTSESSIGW